jgi:spermidine synthase
VAPSEAPAVLFLGGGPYVSPRRLLATKPGARVTVVEIDPGVTRAAQDAAGLADPPPFEVVHEDARTFVRRESEAGKRRWDLVFGDAFHSTSVPFHLTTVECAREVKACLEPGGTYVMNAIDVLEHGRYVGAVLATLRVVFAHVEATVVARDDGLPQNFVLVASDVEPDLEGLRRPDPAARGGGAGVPVPRLRLLDLERLAARNGGFVLTDDFAPVENLLVPVAEFR